jgi:plasmid stabilization system protein ParE
LRHRLTRLAQQDVSKILTDSYRLFGEHQFKKYLGIINSGIAMVTDDPLRASSKDRSDIRRGLRSFHLQLAARRQGGAAHVIFYRPSESDPSELIIVRILGDEMEPKQRVVAALRAEDGRKNQ